jgi:hypothetical protein
VKSHKWIRFKLNLLKYNFLDCIYSPYWLSVYVNNNVYMTNVVYMNKTNQIAITPFLRNINLLLLKTILRFKNLHTMNLFITTTSNLNILAKAFQNVFALLTELYTSYCLLYSKCSYYTWNYYDSIRPKLL